jgi:mannose-6-phosphate isomerase-like protein (cupin superfamily)
MQIVSSTEGDRADFPRLGTRNMIRGEATDGRFALVEHEIPPRALAAPTHMHQHEDEYSFVLEGRVGVQIGDD